MIGLDRLMWSGMSAPKSDFKKLCNGADADEPSKEAWPLTPETAFWRHDESSFDGNPRFA